MNNGFRFVVYGWIILVISACAGQQTTLLSVPGETPDAMIATLQKDLDEARVAQLEVLAPGPYQKARASLLKATAALEKGAKPTTIKAHLAESRRYLNKATETGQIARAILAGVQDARQKALDAGAQKLGEPFNQLEVLYVKVTQAIGKDDIHYAQTNAVKLQQDYRNVEIMAIKAHALGQARGLVHRAGQDKIDKIVPQAFIEAQRALVEADAFIGENPYAADTIRAKANQALFMAQRAMALAGLSTQLQEMDEESTLLFIESQMARLSKDLGAGDIRNLPLSDQVAALSKAAEKMKTESRSLTDLNYSYQHQIAALEERISGLKGFSHQQEISSARLSADRAFNQRIEQVRNVFSPNEAEIHRQGNQVVIRMRGIQFPVGSSILSPKSFALLAKARQAIEAFGQAAVLIEGHTDSTGSPKKNKILSQERAEAVRSYLVANSTLPAARFSAIGHGADRPLAANDTAKERAINRRIDVRVTPDSQP